MLYNPYSLEKKVIFVTGASSGIGRSTAIECSRMGATVIIAARNKDRLKETYSLLSNGDHRMVQLDLSSQQSITENV